MLSAHRDKGGCPEHDKLDHPWSSNVQVPLGRLDQTVRDPGLCHGSLTKSFGSAWVSNKSADCLFMSGPCSGIWHSVNNTCNSWSLVYNSDCLPLSTAQYCHVVLWQMILIKFGYYCVNVSRKNYYCILFENRDNYGFVTFRHAVDAYSAIESK